MGYLTYSADSTTTPRSFAVRLAAGVILVNLIVLCMVVFSLRQSRQQHEERAKVTAQNLSHVLEHSFAGLIDKIDIALLAVAEEAEREESGGGISAQLLNAFMTRKHSHLTELDNLRMADSRGDIVFGTGLIESKRVNIADRDYFIVYRNNHSAGLYISKPVLGRLTGKWLVNIARPVNRQDGSLLGVVWGTISLDYLSTIFASLDIGPHGGISLRDGEMGIIARYPVPKEISRTIGNRTMSPEMRRLFESGQSAGTFFTPVGWDNTSKVVSYRKIANYPLYVHVGLATSDYLAEWRDDVVKMSALAALYVLLTLLMSRAIYLGWKREMVAKNQLLKVNEGLELRVAERTEELITANKLLQVELTERMKAHDALQEAGERLEFALAGTNDGIWDVHMVSGEVYISPRGCEILNYRPDQGNEIATNWNQMVHPEDIPATMLALNDYLEGRTPLFMVEQRLRTASGSWKWILTRGKTVSHAPDGTPLRMVGTHTDVSRRKQYEKELLDKNEELERFTYSVSHDLKSPLITIRSFAGQIMNDMEAGRKGRMEGDLKRISDAAAKMTMLLDDLLELSRVGRTMSPPSTVDMERLVRDVQAQLAGPLGLGRIEVVVQSDLPEMYGDRERIAAVVQNLVENAIKYMGDQVSPRIEIGGREGEKERVFFVCDNGCGIDPRHHDSIFGLFRKLDNSPGTGIGLALVKRIVEVHGGRVWVESEGTGMGSTFCFALPTVNQTETGEEKS